MKNDKLLPPVYTYNAVVSDSYHGAGRDGKDGEDGGDYDKLWVANFPGLSGCWCEGSGRDEVISLMEDTLGRYLAFRELSGLPLPEPSPADFLEDMEIGDVVSVSVDMSRFRE